MSPNESSILEATGAIGQSSADGSVKCDRVIRRALESVGAWTQAMEVAVCNTGYEQPDVARAYDTIRDLVRRGLLEGKGNLALPAGPRYTECGLSEAGRRILELPT